MAAALPGVALLALLVVASLPLFPFGAARLLEGWSWPAFGYGPWVGGLGLGVFAVCLARLDAGQSGPRWPGALAVVAGLLLATVGVRLHFDDAVFAGGLLWLFGLVALARGARAGIAVWPGLLGLACMLPLPGFVQAGLERAFGDLVLGPGTGLAGLMGAEVLRAGPILNFGAHSLPMARLVALPLGVVPALAVVLATGCLLRLRPGPWIGLGMLAGVVVLVLAVLRVAVVLVRGSGMEAEALAGLMAVTGSEAQALVAGLAVVAVGWRMRDRGGRARRLSARWTPVPVTPALVVAALAAIGLGAAQALVPVGGRSEVRVERDAFSLFPPEVAGWYGSRTALTDQTAEILGADDYLAANYYHPDEAAPVDFFSAFYHDQNRERGGIHSPEVCLPNDGWTILRLDRRMLDLAGTGFAGLPVNRAVIAREGVTQLALYWFEGRGRSLADAIAWQAATTLDTFRIGRSDGAIVRVVTTLLEGETEAEAEARLVRFLGATVDLLPRFIPR